MNGVSSRRDVAYEIKRLGVSEGERASALEGEMEGKACGLAADVDELAHALGALLRGSGHDSIRHHSMMQASLAHGHHALASLAYNPAVQNAGGMAGMAVGSAFVGSTAFFAMKAGLHEWREAGPEAQAYRKRAAELAADQRVLTRLPADARRRLEAVGASLADAANERARAHEVCARAATDGGLIGKYSFLSGAGLMARSGLDVASNVGMAAAGHTLHVASYAASGAVAPALLYGNGLLSNGFAMVASGLAVALGAHFIRKTGGASRALRQELPDLRKHWDRVGEHFPEYKKFLVDKSAGRERFLRGFTMKNRIFTGGAALYAAGTILPVFVKLLAASGVLSSKKTTARLILGLFSMGIVGAIGMGVFSHQFLYGHPTLGRYEKYGASETTGFNRRLLSIADVFAFDPARAGKAEATGETLGMELRESAYKMLVAREKTRNGLLSLAASANGRRHTAYAHAGDAEYAGHRPYPTKIRAFLRGDGLGAKEFAAWLGQPGGAAIGAKACADVLGAQLAHKVVEGRAQLRMARQVLNRTDAPANPDERAESILADFETRLTGGARTVHDELNATRDLRAKLLAAKDPDAIRAGFSEFLKSQLGDEYEPEKDEHVEKSVAEYFRTALAEAHNNDRGILLETEREAARLRKTRAERVAAPRVRMPVIR